MTSSINLLMINLGTTAHRKRFIVMTTCPKGNWQQNPTIPSNSDALLMLSSGSRIKMSSKASNRNLRWERDVTDTWSTLRREHSQNCVLACPWIIEIMDVYNVVFSEGFLFLEPLNITVQVVH
mmetsp:Transcript_31599/g.60274  ORF Transcript_31599/g.60274 Transcript_31599/m.60274 type:complete len:123 (+) Transcript_31599:749-1117(+)